jgi:flagellar assembly protein FliH
MNWSARPSLLPPGLEELAVPAFPPGKSRHDASAPWLPDELPEPPVVHHEPPAGAVPGDRPSADGAAQAAGSGGSGTLETLGSAEEKAAREAERVAEERRAELEAAVAAARAEGYAAGEEAGREAERVRLDSAVSAAERALDTLRSSESALAGRLEENLCALAVGVAKQLLARELSADPGLVSGLVRQALIEFPIDQPVSIRINPSDLAVIAAQNIAGDSTTGAAAGRDARWVADTGILPGDCVVEGRERIVDGRVDTALERMYRRLAQVQQ